MGFSELTLIPIQQKLIDVSALSAAEVAWTDAYHARVWEEVSPRLADDQKATDWLRVATKALVV
jgi:Xaa-Pro aminopeptidase